jgi:hypothetical protein
VPQNASFAGELYIGTSAIKDAGVLATIWEYKFIDPSGFNSNYTGIWTNEFCLPVSAVYNQQTHINFYDITLGIQDPNVFTPSKECL